MKPIITYAQNREDLILSAFFSDIKKGFYVDVGAHHPVEDSVTKYFYDLGWAGINIEPQDKLFSMLKKARINDINLHIGVSQYPGTLKLRSYEASGLSTFSNDQKELYESTENAENTKTYTDYEIEVDTLKNIFKKLDVKKIQFLKIDVEGLEGEVLRGNDWKKYRPEIICIESNHIKVDNWKVYIQSNGYILGLFDGLNEYYVAEESLNRLESFKINFPKLLVSAPIISYGWNREIKKQFKQLERVQAELDRQMKENENVRENISNLTMELDQLNEKINQPKFLLKRLTRFFLLKLNFKKF